MHSRLVQGLTLLDELSLEEDAKLSAELLLLCSALLSLDEKSWLLDDCATHAC